MSKDAHKPKKAKRRRTLDDIFRFATLVGETTQFEGTFKGGENFIIRGEVRGDSVVDGAVVIAESGSWHGHITADVVVVGGRVEGGIEAREKIEILASAKVLGTLHSPTLAIANGAFHEGEIRMRERTDLTEFDEKRSTPRAMTSESDEKPAAP
jgi:cytoskeletal protein CcmA (bactofilin family)